MGYPPASCPNFWYQSFGYDQWSNITKSGSVVFNPGYNTANNHANGFSYDAMGNMSNDGSNSYSYDAEGRPIVAGSGQSVVYDAFNRPVNWTANGTTAQIVYDAQGQTFAFMNGASVVRYTVPLAAGVQAVYNASGLQYYRHADWLGSSRLQLDVNGNLYGGRAFAPYGEAFAETGAADRVFTGQTQDALAGSTGIYDFLLRQQSSAQGRWMVPDPAGIGAVDITNPQTWNRYAYVGNNPRNAIDPLGLKKYCPSEDGCAWDVNDNGNGAGYGWGAGEFGDYSGGWTEGPGNSLVFNWPVFLTGIWDVLDGIGSGGWGGGSNGPSGVGSASNPYTNPNPSGNGNDDDPYTFHTWIAWPFLPATPWYCHFPNLNCFKYYGNWGGPGWTGGQFKPYESLTAQEKQYLSPPIDAQDACYMEHDLCYSNARVTHTSTATCDFELQQCLRQINGPRMGNTHSWVAEPLFSILELIK